LNTRKIQLNVNPVRRVKKKKRKLQLQPRQENT